MNVCMLCLHVFMYVCINVCMYVWCKQYAYMYVCTYESIFVCICSCRSRNLWGWHAWQNQPTAKPWEHNTKFYLLLSCGYPPDVLWTRDNFPFSHYRPILHTLIGRKLLSQVDIRNAGFALKHQFPISASTLAQKLQNRQITCRRMARLCLCGEENWGKGEGGIRKRTYIILQICQPRYGL